ncbi:27 kDa glycoprotein [Drosophila tropicalis]|uniref:27 kDa glycoprotein n=1 Tax=Drosophila tropicalis TaxID=46794 RepID=UPI0035ABC679
MASILKLQHLFVALIAYLAILVGNGGVVVSQELSNAKQLLSDAANLKDIEELKANFIPEQYRKTNISLTDLQGVLERKCAKANAAVGNVNATELSTKIQEAGFRLTECVNNLANLTAILDEIEDARPKGDLDVVFEKYCLRMPQAKACIVDFNESLLPCLTREERTHNAVMQRIMNKLLEFICYKNGDQIALFIAEQGPECLEQNRENIGNCLNQTFGGYLPKELANIDQVNLPDFILGPSQCVELYDFETCIVRHLERCETITPSNIVEAMFRYVRKESKCQESIDKAMRERQSALPLTGSASGLHHLNWNGMVKLGLVLALSFVSL